MSNKISVMCLSLFFIFSFFATSHAIPIVDTCPAGCTSTTTLGYELSQYQSLASEFTMNDDYTITDIQGLLRADSGGFNQAGQLTVAIYADDDAGNSSLGSASYGPGEVPGTELFFGSFDAAENLGWYGASGLDWTLSAGTYWVSFEVRTVNGDDYYGLMPNWQPVDNPLYNEAYDYFLNSDWIPMDIASQHIEETRGFGIRINGDPSSPIPEPATMLLFGSGLIALAGFRRKIKNY